MVSYKEIQTSNALMNDTTAPHIAVFVGGTSGIGKLTIKALVSTSAGASMRIYLIGRASSEERTRPFIQELQTLNPKAEIIWTEGEVSLLAETHRICKLIQSKESRVDLLFMTTGYAPFGARIETSESVEITQSLEYYTRMLFILHLLPLLRAAEGGRVVSVLAGGMERATSIDVEDLDLKKPENFKLIKIQGHYGAMNTLFLDKLASDNLDVTFIHSWPGWVNTGNVRRGLDLGKPNSLVAWLIWLFLEPLIRIMAFSDDEAGQRHLFLCTSCAFGGHGTAWIGKIGVNSLGKEGNGLFLVNYKGDCSPNAKVMPLLRDTAQEKVWKHTQEVLGPYL